jgi:hypothetical protein
VRYLAKGTVPDHGEERVSSGHRDYDYLEWIARLTSHIPDRGTLRRCGTISSPTRSRTTVHSKTTGGRTSIHPIPLDARRMRGFRVDSRPMANILTAKGRLNRRRAVWRGHCCRAGRFDPRNTTARMCEASSWPGGKKRNFL